MKNERKRGKIGKTLVDSTWEGLMRRKRKWVAILMIKFLQKMKLGCQSDLWPEKALNRATAITSSFQSGTSFAMKSLKFESIFLVYFSLLCTYQFVLQNYLNSVFLALRKREGRKKTNCDYFFYFFWDFMIFFIGEENGSFLN